MDVFRAIASAPLPSDRFGLFATRQVHRRGDGLRDGGRDTGDNELITDLAPERPALGEAQMMGICRDSAADQARLLGHMADVVAIPNATRFRQG